MSQRFLTVALNTFLETIRQPIYGVILIATTLLMMLNVSLAAFTLDDDDKLLLDIGLSTLLLSGLFLAAFSATGVVSREIENKTALTVISKPIGRPAFILGKFIGLWGALLLAFYLCMLVFILAVRHGVLQTTSSPWDGPVWGLGGGAILLGLLAAAWCNYFYGNHFATTAMAFVAGLLTPAVLLVGKFDEHWEPIPFGSNYVGGQVIVAAYLVFLTISVTAAVALACSTRLKQLPTLMVCVGVLALGIASDYVFGRHAADSTAASLAYHLLPNMGPFWVIDGLFAGTEQTTIPPIYIGYTTAYAVLLTAGFVSIAAALFQRREVG